MESFSLLKNAANLEMTKAIVQLEAELKNRPYEKPLS